MIDQYLVTLRVDIKRDKSVVVEDKDRDRMSNILAGQLADNLNDSNVAYEVDVVESEFIGEQD